MFCDFQSVSQYFKKLSRWFKCTGCVENLPSVIMSHHLIILRKCFWVTNSFSFFFSPHTDSGILFFFFTWMGHYLEDWNVFPANVDFHNVCCWHADESVINRAESWHSYLTTPPFLLVLWLPETCVLWERTSLLDRQQQRASCYPLAYIQGRVLVPVSTPSASGPVHLLTHLPDTGRTVMGRISLSQGPL